MKKFNSKKILAFALVAMLTVSGFSGNVKAAEEAENATGVEISEVTELAGYEIQNEAAKAELEALVKEAAEFAENVEVVDPEKSTVIIFKKTPVKVVKYDGEPHGLEADAHKTIGGAYVDDATILYIGMTEDGTIYRSLEEPVEVGFYYAVAMYPGNADNYPSVAYGVVVILPACETPEVPETPETPEVPETPETPEVPETPETPETPEVPETPETPEVPSEQPETTPVVTPAKPVQPEADEEGAPQTGDSSSVMLYLATVVVAFGAIVAVLAKKRRA